MRIVAEVKAPFMHSQLGFTTRSFTEEGMRQAAKNHANLVYVEACGLLLASGPLSLEAQREVDGLKGRTVV